MVSSASKILTVSYGTFSCTLEGFDEPFAMMRAIAEYFRDLAAEDRYFGAEPPQPDGEALQRLASREIHQRVEARVEGNGVTLRAAEPVPPRPDPVPVAAPMAARVAPPPTGQVNQDVAAKLERIRRAVAEARASVSAPTNWIEEEDAVTPVTDEVTDMLLTLPEESPEAASHPVEAETTTPSFEAEQVAEETMVEEPVKEVPLLLLTPVQMDAAEEVADEPNAQDIPAEDFGVIEAPEEGTAPEPVAEQEPAPCADPEPAMPILDETALEALPQDLAEAMEDAPAEDDPPNASAEQETDTQEDNLRRLFDATEEQLAGNESQRRISAIAQLKAAVAATIAERLAIGRRKHAAPPEVAEADVVPPQAETPDLEPDRTVPLVLVSAQRVDPEAPVQPINPQRIQITPIETHMTHSIDLAGPPCDGVTAQNFARFARSYGSHGLDDLLEAAAAYTAQVEGHSHFSPPEIMHKLNAVAAEGEFTPEERLRVFGRLLRQGKIAKIKPGQYTITEASRFYQKRA
ncbi:MAG TPA: hypothetical protein VGC31_06920 [Paenirhodobacter sp.]